MQSLTLLLSTLSLTLAAPSLSPRQNSIASVDRYAGSGCTGTVCNIAGSGDLNAGCNFITDQCTASLKLNYAPAGCKGEFVVERRGRE
jgi:hypothetical protein